MTPSPTGQQVGLACRGWAEGEDMSKELDDLLGELARLVETYDSIIMTRVLRDLIEKHTPTPPIEEPMKVGAKVISRGYLCERKWADGRSNVRAWFEPSGSVVRWSEMDVTKVVFEGYDT